MIYVFLGKDFNILNKKIEELISSLDIRNIINYDFNDIDFIDILNEVNYIDLFNEKKLVIVSSFSFKKLNEKDEEIFIKYINNLSDNAIILKCIDESIDERKKLTKLLKEKCNIIKCEKLDYKSLHKYIEEMFKKEGKNISYDSVSRILFLCDNNTDVTINECNKLLLYKDKETNITNDDIDKVVSKSTEKEIFTFNESILSKNIGSAIDSYHNLVSGNVDETIIIDCIGRQYRMLYQIKNKIKSMNYIQIARYLKVNEYVVQKLLVFVDKYSDNEIIDLLYKTALMDEQIKIYGFDKKDVLENFIISI